MELSLPIRENMAEALSMQNVRLAALHEVALGLTSTLDLRDVLQRVVEMAQTISASAHAHIFLYDSERDELNLAASHWSADQRNVLLQPRRAGITYLVAHTGTPEFIENLLHHPAYEDTSPDARPGALVCLPLVNADRILGTLNLGYWEPHRFDADTRSFLDLMARQASIAIETARLHADELDKARLEHELHVALQLQTSLMPRDIPRIAGWDFAALWQPARVVSGDFYDFVSVNHIPLLGIVIADVAGKGMPAALYMVLARSTIRASVTGARGPADCITHANRVLCADAGDGMFVTLCYAQLDPATGEFVYVNAGHNPPLLYRHERGQLIELARTGMVLGLYDAHGYEQRSLQLDPGDFVVFYTDGVTEAFDKRQREFGLERLRRVALLNPHASAVDILAALRRAIDEFVGGAPPCDDVTAVVVRRM